MFVTQHVLYIELHITSVNDLNYNTPEIAEILDLLFNESCIMHSYFVLRGLKMNSFIYFPWLLDAIQSGTINTSCRHAHVHVHVHVGMLSFVIR